MDSQSASALSSDSPSPQRELGATAMPPRSSWQIQRAVVFALLLRELKTRFGGRWLGSVWTLAEPLTHTLILMLIYAYLRQRKVAGADYVTYLVSGLLPFFMFRNMMLRMMESIDANRALFSYRQVKPIDTLLARAILEVGIYSTVYLIVLAGIGWFLGLNVVPDRPLELITVSVALLTGGFGLGLTLAVLTTGQPQIRRLFGYAVIPLYVLSGVIFPVHSFPSRLLDWLLINPVLHAIELMRGDYFKTYQQISGVSRNYVFAFGLVSVSLGLGLYYMRRERLLSVP